MTPHKHHDLIVAWAKGAQIQWRPHSSKVWEDCDFNHPCWAEQHSYRIKPEPKPDVIVYGNVEWSDVRDSNNTMKNYIGNVNCAKLVIDNVKYTFCGETGKLKKAEVIDEA